MAWVSLRCNFFASEQTHLRQLLEAVKWTRF